MTALIAADVEALKPLPSGWFRVDHLPFNRPMLDQCGKLQRRTNLLRRVCIVYAVAPYLLAEALVRANL